MHRLMSTCYVYRARGRRADKNASPTARTKASLDLTGEREATAAGRDGHDDAEGCHGE
jgi:hypothetical protein